MVNVRERSPGHWEIRAYAGVDPVTGKKKWKWATYKAARAEPGYGRRGAERAQRALQADVDAKRPGTGMTVAAFLEEWLEDVRARRAPSTVAGYEVKVRAISEGPLGPIALDKLAARDIDGWYARLLREGWSAANVKAHHRVLSAALATAERWEWLAASPARRVQTITVPEPETRAPSPAELAVLLRAAAEAKARYLASIILWAVLTGMRRGEVCALRWSDVNRRARTITVRRSIWQLTNPPRWGEKDTKGHRRRTVLLEDMAAGLLTARYEECRARAKEAKVPWGEDGFVWAPSADALTPLMPDTYGQAFSRLVARVAEAEGGEWPFRLHDLRGMTATELIAGGMDVVTVAAILGHDPRVTLRAYAHIVEERKREAAGVLERAILPALAPRTTRKPPPSAS